MSLKEKIGQLCQLCGDFLGGNSEITGPSGNVNISSEDVRLIGSVLNAMGAEEIKALQDKFMANHPHHIPLLFMMDVINGYETIFPIPLAQSCTFEPSLSEKLSRVASKEASCEGIHVTFAPMADLVQDSRWGRVMESCGEDPYLSGLFSAAMTRGFQAVGLDKKGNIAAFVKHLAGYGMAEGGREYENCEISMRKLLDDCMNGYTSSINEGVALAMTSFNTLDRIPSTANKWLMRDILRDKMGFDGVLISDWQAVEELISHGVAETKADAARLAIEAGVDIDMMSDCYLHELEKLVNDGVVNEKLIDESCMRILKLKNKLGLFENPYKDASKEDEDTYILCDEHRELAREVASKSFVLLKNDDSFFPLKASDMTNTAFIGPYVYTKRLYGAWSWVDDEDKNVITVEKALKEACENVKLARGSSVLNIGTFAKDFVEKTTENELADMYTQAVKLAKECDKVVLFLGEERNHSAEASARAETRLQDVQLELLKRVYDVNTNIAVVVFSGRPVDLREILPYAKAVMMAWMPGTEGGHAIVDVITGKKEVSGRLTMGVTHTPAQMPLTYRHFNTGRPCFKDYDFNFRTGYNDYPNTALYPFGYGLSYTTFEYSSVTLDSAILHDNSCINASVTVTNTGERKGSTVVQMYIRDMVGSVVRPVKELKGFEKITLEPKESKTVTFKITEDMLRFYRIDMSYGSEKGAFTVYIGDDSSTENMTIFTLE